MMFTMKYKTRELKVKEFHKKFDLDVDSQPRASLLCLRSKLILEEANEVSEVLNEMSMDVMRGKPVTNQQTEHLLKELADLQYVLSGTVVALGNIKTDNFDDSIMEFEIREGTYAVSRRVYSDEGVSPTITASNPDAKITTRNDVIRRLTPVECERLQGLPDNYTQIPYRGKPKEDCPVSKRYEACGRAMSVNVMEWLGSRIKQVHNGEI